MASDLVVLPPARVPPRDTNPAYVYLAGLGSASTRRNRTYELRRLARRLLPGSTLDSFPWCEVRYPYVLALKTALGSVWSAGTANNHLYALRGVLGAAFDLGQLDPAEWARIRRVKPIPGKRLPGGRALDYAELERLFTSCYTDHVEARGLRDAAALALTYGAGLRRAEAVSLRLEDLGEEGRVRIEKGKGAKDRFSYLPHAGREVLSRWLAVRGDWAGPVLCALTRRGMVLERGMTTYALYYLLRRRRKRAGLKDAFSPHDLRRTFISNLLDSGADLALAQLLAGHSNPATTSRYDRRPERAAAAAAERLRMPAPP